MYVDADGDGFGPVGATNGFPYCLRPGSTKLEAPPGYSLSRDDCDDAEVRAFPGQSEWQSAPTATGGWDFDCDGVIRQERPDGNASCRFILAACATAPNAWVGAAPTCGVAGQLLLGCDAACQPIVETRTQRCR